MIMYQRVAQSGVPLKNKHVAGLQVAVNDPGVVCRLNPARDLCEQHGGLVRGEANALPEPLGEGAPGEVFHDEVRSAVGLARLVHANDVWVVDGRNRFGFDQEAVNFRAPGAVLAEHHLDRDRPVQPRLAGLVDDPHPAGRDLFEHLVPGHHWHLLPNAFGVVRAGGQILGRVPERGDERVGVQSVEERPTRLTAFEVPLHGGRLWRGEPAAGEGGEVVRIGVGNR